MRTVHFYRTGNQAWVSFTRYLSAILSGEPLIGVDHSGLGSDSCRAAADQAMIFILCMLGSSLWVGFRGLLYATGLTLLVFYPPLQQRVPGGIHGVFVLLVLIAGCVSIYSILKVSLMRCVLLWKSNKITYDIRKGPSLDPPVIAHRSPEIHRPLLSRVLTLVVVAIMLNSVILATPLRPALVNGVDIHESSFIAWPGASWKAVERYPTDIAFSYFHYDGVGLWGVQVSYSVEQIDLLVPAPEFRSWMQSYLFSISNNVNNQIASSFTPEMTEQQRLDSYLIFWEDPEMAEQLTVILTSGFNSVYDSIMQMRGMNVSVRYISVTEYQKLAGN